MSTTSKRRPSTKSRRPAPKRSTSRARSKPKSRTPLQPHHHPELWGLASCAVGLVLVAILWLGWEGGFVGEYATEWLDDGIGSASVLLPVVLCAVGGLMLVRSALVTLTPFKAGLVVTVSASSSMLGADHGGLVGRGIGGGLARVVGETGSVIIGVATCSRARCC